MATATATTATATSQQDEEWAEILRNNGIVLESVDWRDKDDVVGVCEMLNVDKQNFPIRHKVKDFLRRYTDTPFFRVNASVEGARYVAGFRASMYMLAEEFNAFREPATAPIRYDEGDRQGTLRLSLLFENRQRAMECATKLRNWKFNHPMIASSLEEIQVDGLPAKVPFRDDLAPVLLNDYDPGKADDSPCTSLADFRGLASVLPTEPIQLTEPLSKYQSIESDGIFTLRNPYKLYIKDKARFKALREEESNMLAGSWNFHQLFDGLHTNEGHLVPSLGIEWVKHAEDPTQMDDGEMRYMVTLRVHFFSDLAENDLRSSLKNGSTDEGGRKWRTHVFVKKPEVFKECIQWKYAHACKT